jgi:putative transposase
VQEAVKNQVCSVAKQRGLSKQTIYTWRNRFGGLQADDVRRLKRIEQRNPARKDCIAAYIYDLFHGIAGLDPFERIL